MTDIKRCKRCGKIISDINSSDWYSHIRIQYCDACRKQSDREKTAIRVAKLRERKRQKDKFRDKELELMRERVAILEEENELIRQRLIKSREEKQ
ncbi:MAG: hypothetical protein PUH54_03330 [Oscillospiraceae bacterium]|nr:hypothetical protein [Oscillospiraceae bacterium]